MTLLFKPRQTNARSRYFIDPQVQGLLMRQALWHWVWTLATLVVVIVLCRIAPAWLSGRDNLAGSIWYHLGPYVLASAVLYPIIMLNSVRFSHRFVGPVVRVRRALQELAKGECPPTLRFRKRDCWKDLADEINRVTQRVHALQKSTAAASADEIDRPCRQDALAENFLCEPTAIVPHEQV